MKLSFPRTLHLAFFLLIVAGLLFSCSKSSDTKKDSNSFTWTFQGVNYTANQDTAFISGIGIGTHTIYAGTGISYMSYTRRFYFTLSSFNVGAYTFGPGPSSPNHFFYIDEMGWNWGGTSGTFNITANANNRMSGNFSATLNGPAGLQPVSGSFTDLPIRP